MTKALSRVILSAAKNLWQRASLEEALPILRCAQNDTAPLVSHSMTFGPLDTVFTLAGILVIGAGIYAMLALRGISLTKKQPIIAATEEIAKI